MLRRYYDLGCAVVSLGALAAVLLLGGGCREAEAPGPRDDLEELAALVAGAREAVPPAREVCQALPPAEAQRCHGVLDAVDDLLAVAGPVVDGLPACREAVDLECLDGAREVARKSGPSLRRLLPLVRFLAGGAR